MALLCRPKLLVAIFQRGAVDGLNVVVPYGEAEYFAARPSIAVDAPGRELGALDLDGFFGLHPRLKPLMPFWTGQRLAVVHATGSPDATRSHFDAQDFMESATPGVKGTPDGWLNRTPPGLAPGALAQSLLQVDSYGGAVNTRRSDATPVPQRSSILKLQYQTYWNNDSAVGQGGSGTYQAQAAAHLSWIRGFYADVYAAYGGTPDPTRDASGTVDGCYYNYPDSDLGTRADGNLEQALRLYFGDNLRRNARSLVGVKRRWDPRDYFNGPQSIPVR
jgi:uncharacterized protein (DUF1501 family)